MGRVDKKPDIKRLAAMRGGVVVGGSRAIDGYESGEVSWQTPQQNKVNEGPKSN